jgi:hypothetical protein
MSPLPSLLCPSCGAPRLEASAGQVSGLCRACGWRELPQFLSRLPALKNGLLRAALGQVWLAGNGQCLAFSPSSGEWRAFSVTQVKDLRHAAEDLREAVVRGLAFTPESLILALGEPKPLGKPRPLLALNPQSGDLLWQVESAALEWSAPAVDGSVLCAVNSLGQVHVLDPVSGAPRWKNPPALGSYPRPPLAPRWSEAFLLLVTPAGELLWLRRRDGRPAGRFAPPAPLHFPPACRDESAWLCAGQSLYRLDLRSGQAQELFRASRRSSQGWFFAAPQVTPQGILLLHADFDAAAQPAYALSLLDAESGAPRWKLSLPRHPYFAPALEGERLALPDRDGHLLLVELSSGAVILRLPLGEEQPAADPVFLEGELYLLTESGSLLRFSPHLRLKHLPDAAETCLARGDWLSAALRRTLQGEFTEAAKLYKAHQHLDEARLLYDLAGDTAARERLTRQGADFRLSLHADSALREGQYNLLTLTLQNLGAEQVRAVRLQLSSEQLDITTPEYAFGALLPGESKTWQALQVRPRRGKRGDLLLHLTLTWRDAQGKRRQRTFDQGLTVLQAEQRAAREIHIHIGGNVTDSVLIAGDKNVVTRGQEGG